MNQESQNIKFKFSTPLPNNNNYYTIMFCFIVLEERSDTEFFKQCNYTMYTYIYTHTQLYDVHLYIHAYNIHLNAIYTRLAEDSQQQNEVARSLRSKDITHGGQQYLGVSCNTYVPWLQESADPSAPLPRYIHARGFLYGC